MSHAAAWSGNIEGLVMSGLDIMYETEIMVWNSWCFMLLNHDILVQG